MLTLLLCVSALLITSCKTTGNYTQSGGLADQAYLILVSSGEMAGKSAEVYVDGKMFEATVLKEKKSAYKGMRYAVNTGRRHIKIVIEGQVVYEKQIMTSPQETQKIVL